MKYHFIVLHFMTLIIKYQINTVCAEEIDNVERWAEENDLLLNRTKSVKILFVSPRSKQSVVIPRCYVPGFSQANTA